MPDGRQLTLPELAAEMRGRTPEDAYKSCGYDLGEITQMLGMR